ncbi:MAG: FHA domain-containing protein [Myxococcales bacterium]|nr:FHA domain-containing protein [Myxococcales bacterium]MCB9644187.1 FHA domain-containing protein [Myxococcales bacterium]
MAELILTLKGQILKRHTLSKEETTIGRDVVNDFCIDNPGVSRFQARVVKHEGHFFLLDEGSSNGTFVNGKRITQLQLNDADEIQLAKYKIIFSQHTSSDEDGNNAAMPNFLASTESTMLYSDNDLKKMIDDESSQRAATRDLPMAGFSHEQQMAMMQAQAAAPRKPSNKKNNSMALMIIIAIVCFGLGFALILLLL